MGGVGHGKGKAGPDGESLLGETTPDHARPSAARALRVGAFWLALWVAPTIAIALIAGTGNVFTLIAVFFSKMALVTFGGAYAVLAYIAQQAVSTYHWVTPGEMLDGLGMAETTPGPLIMVLQFVGFMAAFRAPGLFSPLLAGALGGLLATWVTFTPCFLWIFVGGPYIEHLRGHKLLTGALSAITAAVVGVVLNLAVWFAIHAMFRVTLPLRGWGLSFDMPVVVQHRCRERRHRSWRSRGDLPFQGRHDPYARARLPRRDRAAWVWLRERDAALNDVRAFSRCPQRFETPSPSCCR